MTDRVSKDAALKGWRNKCPNCGSGRILRNYLKVVDTCDVCGEPLGRARADDGPAYLTMLVVGHLLLPIMGWLYVEYTPNPFVVAIVFSVAAIVLSLWLLPRFKGMIVGFQWAKRMHGL